MSSSKKAPGAPVSVVVIGVENLDASLKFYAGTLGLNIAKTWTWQGPDFERLNRVVIKKAGAESRQRSVEHPAERRA